ncbi:hypothetical protein ABVK25_003805 [Lepraria finkii]|uniref:Uncharacterized protein n=1 Tax=Lepraria finkii TaxID=1340010 RepID=A0ABR4BFF0_9LECA
MCADSLREETLEKAQELMNQMKKEADLVAAQERSKENLELRRQKLAKATATRQKVDKQWEGYGGASKKLIETQKRDLEQMLSEEKKLGTDLQKLRDDNTSLAETKKTLSRAIVKLVDLTQCIRQTLLFFGKATKVVDNIVEHQDDEFVSLLQIEDIPESEDDPEELRQAT